MINGDCSLAATDLEGSKPGARPMTNQADKAALADIADRDDLHRRFITYVLPDEPDTLYVLLAAARDRMPPEAQQGPAFECAADLCRALLDVLPSIHAIVLGGTRFESRPR